MPNMAKLFLPGDPQPLAPLGHAVRARRQALGLSQEDLAERSGLDRTYVGSVERGERNLTLLGLFRLAVGLQTPPEALLADVSEQLLARNAPYAQALRRGRVEPR